LPHIFIGPTDGTTHADDTFPNEKFSGKIPLARISC